MQFVLVADNAQYLIVLEEVDIKSLTRSCDVFKHFYSDDEEDFTEYEIRVLLLEGVNVTPKRISELPTGIKETIGDELLKAFPKIFVANPYFDEMMIFFGKPIFTSQDKYKQISCEQCERSNLYEARDKTNKANFINGIQELLKRKINSEWPFQEDLLVQFTVSDSESRLKKVDVDNIAKSLFDALQGVVYKNDSQIVAFAGDKSCVQGIQAFIVAIKRMSNGEKPLYQEFLFSGKKNAWKPEYEQKGLLNKGTRFVHYDKAATDEFVLPDHEGS